MIHLRSVSFAAVLGSVCALTLFPAPVLARDPPAVAKLIQKNRRALDDYDNLDWKSAKRQLQEAIAEGNASGIQNHPIMARTYLHLGAVFLEGFKDRDAAIQAFVHALQIDPNIRIAQAMETPGMAAVFAEAQGKAGAAEGGGAAPSDKSATGSGGTADEAPASPEPAKPAGPSAGSVAALDCPNTDEVERGSAAAIRCMVAPTLKVASMALFYRTSGGSAFASVDMKKSGKSGFAGEIPADVTDGKAVQFYVEGRDRNGKAIVANGNSGSPNLILVRDEAGGGEAQAAASSVPAAASEENPLEESHIRKEMNRDAQKRFPPRKWWIGLGLGSGFGYAKGDGLEVRKDLQNKFGAGLGWAGLGQVTPELGVHVNPTMALAAQGRLQWIPQSGKDKRGASGAIAVMVKALFYTAPDQLRFYGGPAVGYGAFRFVFTPDESDPNAKDSVRGGPVLAGGGVGMSYALARAVSFILELNALAGFPTFSAVGDVNAGLQVNFF